MSAANDHGQLATAGSFNHAFGIGIALALEMMWAAPVEPALGA